jgi:transcriptional regulator with XRE-family HTH domain
MHPLQGTFTASTCGFGRQRQRLAAKIRVARAALGWSQTELARRVGLTQRAIYRLENAAAGCRKSTICAINAAFDEAGIRFQPMPDGGFMVTVPSSLLGQEARQSG